MVHASSAVYLFATRCLRFGAKYSKIVPSALLFFSSHLATSSILPMTPVAGGIEVGWSIPATCFAEVDL